MFVLPVVVTFTSFCLNKVFVCGHSLSHNVSATVRDLIKHWNKDSKIVLLTDACCWHPEFQDMVEDFFEDMRDEQIQMLTVHEASSLYLNAPEKVRRFRKRGQQAAVRTSFLKPALVATADAKFESVLHHGSTTANSTTPKSLSRAQEHQGSHNTLIVSHSYHALPPVHAPPNLRPRGGEPSASAPYDTNNNSVASPANLSINIDIDK